ncbi:MAG: hypothetical protein DYH04_10845 [Nitrospira sp. NTP2]|nr:hypothetical protein [Nitrospira sp. NTP2]RIK60393.1 MAG: hypothetical protein DCC63_04800 [Nitrospira sp.]
MSARERARALALLPLLATGLYYGSPSTLQATTLYQFMPQLSAYLAFGVWSYLNEAPLQRIGLLPWRVTKGLSWGIGTGVLLGPLNVLFILKIVPLLGSDYRFLAETPHAKVPLWLMAPWVILVIATLVELNFRGFLLGRLVALGLPHGIAVPISALLFAFDPFMVATFQHLHWIAVWDGLVWGTLYVTLKNLLVPIVAHTVEVLVLYGVMRSVLM